MRSFSIIIHWYGPFSFNDAINIKEEGIYFTYGRNKKGATPENCKLLYCGISERDIGERINEHCNDSYNHQQNEWWIGRQIFPRKKSRQILEFAEWIVVYFTAPEHNFKKRKNPPTEEIFLINEWFFSTTEERRRNNIGVMQKISDVLCWSPDSSLVREGNLRVWEHRK